MSSYGYCDKCKAKNRTWTAPYINGGQQLCEKCCIIEGVE